MIYIKKLVIQIMTNTSMFLAPGDVAFPPFFNSHKFKNLEFDYGIGTSVSAPIIEGIAATIITNILLVINLISG